jgi:hypothetical protein
MSDWTEVAAKAMWEHRRAAAKLAKIELLPWDEELESLRAGVRSEARVVFSELRDLFAQAGNSSYDLAADAIDEELK